VRSLPKILRLVAVLGAPLALGAQAARTDALSVTLVDGPAVLGRGALRLRTERVGTGVDLVASGIVVRPGGRTTAELRADTTGAVRRYVTETRDSAGRVIDRVELVAAGGRMVWRRTAVGRRAVREFPAPRGLLLRDDEGLVPLLLAAARADSDDSVTVFDVRRGTHARGRPTAAPRTTVSIAEVPLDAAPMTVRGASGVLLAWWRDARGRLLFAPLDATRAVRRDDPPT
jgi:hypothetical protein